MACLFRVSDPWGADLELDLSQGVLSLEIQDDEKGWVFVNLPDEQAEQLERALYLHRINKPFTERQNEETA